MSADRHYYETHRTRRRSRMLGDAPTRIDRSNELARNIPQLLTALQRDIVMIEESIASEEAATQRSDRSRIDYSLVARSLIVRRDNLVATKMALAARLPAGIEPNQHSSQ